MKNLKRGRKFAEMTALYVNVQERREKDRQFGKFIKNAKEELKRYDY